MAALAILEKLAGRAAVAHVPVPEIVTPTQADYNAMVKARRRELHAIAEKFGSGDLTDAEWSKFFESVLLEGHTSAWQMGRHLSGDLTESVDDVLWGLGKAAEPGNDLRGFLADLVAKDPRYWNDSLETWNVDAIKSRSDLYLPGMRASANEAFVKFTPHELDEFWWRLGGAEHHCEDCPLLASLSPYTKATIVAQPGSRDTECREGCTCYWEREDGVSGFKVAEL